MGYGVYRVPQFRLEPKNFVHPFDNVDYIVFVASLSGYDSYLIDNKSLVSNIPSCTAIETLSNHCIIRIDYRAISLFRSLLLMTELQQSSICLILNKTDFFAKRLKINPVSEHLPDYAGPGNDLQNATAFFKNKFVNLDEAPGRFIHVHTTQ